MRINNYNKFSKEKEFESILEEIFRLVESEGKWTSSNTYEWDLSDDEEPFTFEWDFTKESIKDKLKSFLSKLPKDKIKDYYYKFIDSIKSLPESIRKKLIYGYTAIFLTFTSVNALIPSDASSDKDISMKIKTEVLDALNKIKENVKKITSFDKAQGIVKQVEAGYSDDRGDTGNWIKVSGGKRFVGTNHGISAPVLAEYLGRLPKKEDMQNLSYETALEIYKKNYWDKHNVSRYENQSVANLIYDGLVNQGETGMRDVLRKALNENGIKITDSDNPFDKEWISKSNELDQKVIFNSIKKYRENRYREARTFRRHGEGWLNRLNSFDFLSEKINVPIEIGDTVLGGRFKNKKMVVKKIGKNKKGDITINDKPLLKYRIVKESLQEDVDYYFKHLEDDGFFLESKEDYIRICKPSRLNDRGSYSISSLQPFQWNEIVSEISRYISEFDDTNKSILYLYVMKPDNGQFIRKSLHSKTALDETFDAGEITSFVIGVK